MKTFISLTALFALMAFGANANCVPATDQEVAHVREVMALNLLDSESARFRDVCSFERKLDRTAPDRSFCGLVNAKNAFGAFTGFRRFFSGAKGGMVDDGSTVFESVYCKSCFVPELTMKACFDRTLELIKAGKLPRK